MTDTANNWNIPAWLELEVRARDKACVYCGTPFTSAKVSKRSAASWEHVINDETIITRENIALCCCGCNASKGQKPLSLWLQSRYCQERGITPISVAEIIRQTISKGLELGKEQFRKRSQAVEIENPSPEPNSCRE